MDPLLVAVVGALLALLASAVTLWRLIGDDDVSAPAYDAPYAPPEKNKTELEQLKDDVEWLKTFAEWKCGNSTFHRHKELCDWDDAAGRYKTPEEGGSLRCKTCRAIFLVQEDGAH